MPRRLTLIAGSGALVPEVAAAAKRNGDVLQVLDLVGRGDVAGDVVRPALLSDASAMIQAIRTFPSSHLVLAGGVHMSDADREGIARAFGLVGRLARSLGDIGLATTLLVYFRLVGVKLIGAHEIARDILAEEGLIGGPPATPAMHEYAQSALKAARGIGALDLGQSVVASGRRLVAAEDIAGTDALMERVGALRARGLTGDGATPLVLAKALKPRQPTYVDLPAIGRDTVRNAAAAGISVVAVEAGRSLVLERAQLKEEADRLGVTVIGVRLARG